MAYSNPRKPLNQSYLYKVTAHLGNIYKLMKLWMGHGICMEAKIEEKYNVCNEGYTSKINISLS